MGDGTEGNPYTRKDVIEAIRKNGDKAKGLDLSEKWFEREIDLRQLDLIAINLKGANLVSAHLEEADLRDAHLEEVYLGDAHLEKACLLGAHLEEVCLFGAHLEKAILAGVHLEGVDLVSAHLEGTYLADAHLEGADLRAAHLEGADLGGAEFSSDTKLEEVDWGNYILAEEKNGAYRLASDTYRRLKLGYTEHGMYEIAGKFFYREMEAKRKARSWKGEPHLKLWDWVLRLLCGYGEKPERVVISTTAIIFGLATAYYFLGSFDKSSFLDSLYYSIVSFVAVGYGSWAPQPIGWVKGLGAFEAFVGVFMMALFLVTFVRKMTR